MSSDLLAELEKAIVRILKSTRRKKLIVAGPGTGKTTLFRRLLQSSAADGSGLVMTFIRNLEAELKSRLGDIARVFTFHGYCHYLLRKAAALRAGLTDAFRYCPGLASLIKRDWELLGRGTAPHFVGLMRDLKEDDAVAFYMDRSNYYDAVDFDDSVFRVYRVLRETPAEIESSSQVLVDEYQDFNRLEVALIDLLASRNPILIVGDDDQALYAQLKGASHEFIRNLHRGGDYETFELPFCMRCPEVVVEAMNDIVEKARSLKRLQGRIEKPYRPFPPKKGADSAKYPKVKVVDVSTQMLKANYMGRYIAQAARAIPEDEIEESRKDAFPTVLVIGPTHYLKQIEEHLRADGLNVEKREERDKEVSREVGLSILSQDANASLGWRVLLSHDRPPFEREAIQQAVGAGVPLVSLLPEEYRRGVLEEVETWRKADAERRAAEAEAPEPSPALVKGPTVRLTTFEGSKGLSAQHVFIVGLQERELPHDAGDIKDLEICRLLVALTRTRKECHLMYTWRFSGQPKRPSVFLGWIRPERCVRLRVDSKYWKAKR